MRILANYGHRSNGDSYSVTFESMGDCPMEKAEETVDELFRLAKGAVQRQIDEKAMEFPPKEQGVTVPRVASNGNGNGYGKNDDATDKQKNFLRKLAADKRKGVIIDELSKQDASQLIKELVEV